METTVCVGTYGDTEWVDLAHSRAMPSVEGPVIHRHGTTLAQARNEALALVDTEWVIFLDADDELEPGYIDAMARGSADIRVPSVAYVRNGSRRRPLILRVAGHRHRCTADCLPDGNFIVIGAAVRTELVRQAGGFREYEWSEDWDLWTRIWQAGATIETIANAVYRAHVRYDSRNRGPGPEFREKVHWQIHAANFA